MKLIPEVKEKINGERVEIKGCKFVLPDGVDQRIVKLVEKVPSGDTEVRISIGEKGGDSYKITFDKSILVEADSTKGAFYAIQTIRQIVKNGYYDVKEIKDAPDFEVRGDRKSVV